MSDTRSAFSRLARTALSTGVLAATLLPLAAAPAMAQAYPPSNGDGYYDRNDDGPPPGYDPRDDRSPDDSRYRDSRYGDSRDSDPRYDDRRYADSRDAPPEPIAPDGYDGRSPPPPPPGYRAMADEAAMRAADARYSRSAEDWARNNCVKSQSNAGVGAVVGGLLGAVIGSSVAGYHDRGTGALAGAAIGAAGGAIVGSASAGTTSPGCPPGYSVRRNSVTYVYDSPDYYYAAPGWYRPWVFVDDGWVYRPYPYHDWYYRTYRGGWGGPRGYDGRGPGRPRYYYGGGRPRGETSIEIHSRF